MKIKYILGLNIYHGDSSACIMRNGEIIFAIEEERINRIKHWAGLPIESIKACLKYANISLEEIDYIAINSNPFSNFYNKIKYSLINFKNYKFFLNKLMLKSKKTTFDKLLKKQFKLSKLPTVKYYDHHLCHMASAYFPSKYSNSLLISADGFGDFASTVAAIANKNSIDIKHKILFPHSLGIFYQAFTQFLGFKNYGDEYKVMGLSAYGKDKFKNKIDQVIISEKGSYRLNLNFFQHHTKNMNMKWDNESPKFDNLYNENLNKLFEYDFENKEIDEIHMDLARSIQEKYEEVILNYINFFKNKFNINHLSLSGGCAMNSLANGKIIKKLNFKDVYIPPAPGDAGGAIGAAILCDKEYFNFSHQCYSTPYLGGDLQQSSLNEIIKKKISNFKSNEKIKLNHYDNDEKLVDEVAQSIFNNNVVGWYQNRMEWGPRALGNRSILANPCNQKMKDIINLKIKRREKFRPFAPSIIKESVSDWFEMKIDVPYMGIVLKINEDKKEKLPAVTHVDGTGRLQTVDKDKNLLYYKLIKAFSKISGVPILLNTSFNENEPIVNTPEEAIDCFLRTQMDVLVVGNYILKR
tara:strand:- start:448 stop:2190 length:1743 start_codon:yes stop_codon:yes gene_type:complete